MDPQLLSVAVRQRRRELERAAAEHRLARIARTPSRSRLTDVVGRAVHSIRAGTRPVQMAPTAPPACCAAC